MSLDIEAPDVIKLILQFLKEQNLNKTALALQEESQVAMNTVESVERLSNDIVHGRWDKVLEVASTLVLPVEKVYDLYEHVVLELAEMKEVDAARALLRESQVFASMKKERPDRYMKLEHMLQRNSFEASEAYGAAGGRDKRRQQVANAIQSEVVTVPPSRLIFLLNQALKFQQYQGLLPKGARYDLFRGASAVSSVEEELPIGRPHKQIKFGEAYPECAAFTPDGQYLITGSIEGFVEVWDFDSGKLAKDLKYQAEDEAMVHEDSVVALCVSRDSDYIASGTSKGEIRVWRLKTGGCIQKFVAAHTGSISSLRFSKDGTQLLSSSYDTMIKVHGLRSGRTLKQYRGHSGPVNYAIFSEDESQIYSASDDGTVKIWDIKSPEPVASFGPYPADQPQPPIHTLLPVADFKDRIVVCSKSPTCHIMTTSGKIVTTFSTTGKNIVACAFSSKGKYLYVIAEDSVLFCFVAESGKAEHVVKLHEKEVTYLAHHPHRNILGSCSVDGTLKIWRSG